MLRRSTPSSKSICPGAMKKNIENGKSSYMKDRNDDPNIDISIDDDNDFLKSSITDSVSSCYK